MRQHLTLLIHPGVYQDIYDVQVILQALSGDDRNWYRMNRTFLTELRKEFLQWRSLTPSTCCNTSSRAGVCPPRPGPFNI